MCISILYKVGSIYNSVIISKSSAFTTKNAEFHGFLSIVQSNRDWQYWDFGGIYRTEIKPLCHTHCVSFYNLVGKKCEYDFTFKYSHFMWICSACWVKKCKFDCTYMHTILHVKLHPN